jgi:hypothetical protein
MYQALIQIRPGYKAIARGQRSIVMRKWQEDVLVVQNQ